MVCDSAARLWFRNAIAAGLPVFQLKDVTKLFEEGDQIEIDLTRWCIRNSKGAAAEHRISTFPPTVMQILEEGGIMSLLKKRADANAGQRPTA